MKFSLKIVIGTMLIVIVMFSILGIILIHKNFKNSYHLQMKQNIEEHYLEKYSIENNIKENVSSDGMIQKDMLQEYLYTLTSYLENSRKLAIFIDQSIIWNNLPFGIEEDVIKNNVKIYDFDSKKYSIISSSIIVNDQVVEIVSVYDITPIFVVRNQNLIYFYLMDVILIIFSGGLITIFVHYLTKPIKKLNDTTKRITAGDYSNRIDIRSNDEIGELASSFNAMSSAIESKILEMEKSVEEREEFVSNFTHELKTPMTSIMGYAKILKQNRYTKEDKEKALDYIYSESKRLEVFSHKLLDLMELSNGRISFEIINTKMYFAVFKDLVLKRFNEIQLDLDIEESNILIDEDLITSCIINLIENAVKASSINSKIKIVGKKVNNKYRISVIDEGCGISSDEIKRVTENFYMIDKSRSKSKGGYGIGLSLCSRIADLHHTTLQFKSEVGRGTTVSIDLEVVKNSEK